MLRVIAGIYRSRKLEQPPRDITRPARDMVKESFFSIIHFKLQDALVLDLFAGSASLAIEALSRGAAKAVAVDLNSEAINVMNKNKSNLGITNLDIIKMDVLSFLGTQVQKYDIIFLDPPYKMIDLYSKSLDLIARKNLLSDNGYIILETDSPDKITAPIGLTLHKTKKYGKTYILIFTINV